MGDEREFKILITGEASSVVASSKQAKGALEDVKGEILDGVNPAWAHYGRQTEEATAATEGATAATEKMELSHRELHMALRVLGPEFAHLGGMAQHALENQALLPVLGLVGAFALWEHRINACVEALGGVELPDNAKSQVGQIGALAASWHTFNKALMDAATEYSSVDEASKRTIETLKAEEEQKKKLLEADKKLELSELERQKGLLTTAEYEARKAGIENRYEEQSAQDDDEAQVKKLQQKAKRGADLVESSKQKMAEAAKIHLGTPEQEAAIDAQMKEQADAAEKSAKERQDRIKDIFETKDNAGSVTERLARFGRLVGRYGLVGANDIQAGNADEILKMEREGGAGEQTTIDRYRKRMEGKAGRDDEQEQRKKLVADAAKEAAEAQKIWQEGPGDAAAYDRSVDNRRAVAATNAQARRNSADAKSQEEALKSGLGKGVGEVATAEQMLSHGQQISASQQAQVAAFTGLLKALGLHSEVILKSLGEGRDTLAQTNAKIAAITSQIQQLRAQHRDTYNQ